MPDGPPGVRHPEAMDQRHLSAWPITPTAMTRTAHGLNNDTFFVAAREGDFVLRVYRNTADASRVRDEHELLARLSLQELPFAVPAPVRTREGDTLAVLETSEGPRLATLFHRIPGGTASMTARDARLAGRALAQLDAALARLDLPVRAPASLRDVHPLVPDPLAALDDLDLGAHRARIVDLFERLGATHEALVTSLPRQIVHGDFAFINVLINDGVVTGMLDFEFAGPDVRAADLAYAIYITVVRAAPGERWPLIDALASGYRRALPLDPAEAAAVPELLLRRSAFGIVHWIGRWRSGLCGPEEPLARVERNALLSEWLAVDGPRVALTVAGAKLPVRRSW
jgi:homoserine kinase type II